MTNLEILQSAIEHFGKEAQEKKAIEEMAELIVELTRPERRKDKNSICEEIADVQIMLDQLSLIYENRDIEMWRDIKLKRLDNYLKEWNQK